MANINTNIENNSIDNKSFALLRTNPKLTSNIKLVVDSVENIFLSSFKANKELSKVEYQRYEIKSSGSYSTDVSKYYKRLPNSEKFQTLRQYSDLTLYSDYEFQYEDHYNFGASFNSTKLYNEQYKMFAPIWLDKKIPSKFVIYRVEDVDYTNKEENSTEGQNNRILELLNKATIIKTFDLSINSNVGKYLNNHVNDKLFPKTMLTINFEEGEKSSYNGIDTNLGGFVKKHEILEEYYTGVDYPEIFNNETITQGFERNGIISANIINLEFLFDDENAEDYKIYRYFGLYVDSHDEGSFKPNYINKDGEISIDPSSYKTYYDLSGTSLVDLDMLPNIADLSKPTLNYIKDKEGRFYHILNKGISSNIIESNKVKINIDRSTASFFDGFAKTGEVIEAISKSDEFKGFIKITIKDTPANNDKLLLADKFELEISDYNLGKFLIIADDSIPTGKSIDNRFSTQGSFEQIAISLKNVIVNLADNQYKCTVDGTSIIIEDYAYGNRRRQSLFSTYKFNISDFANIDSAEKNSLGLEDIIVPPGVQPLFNDWNMYTMIGGSVVDQAITVGSDNIGSLQVGEYVKQINSTTFIKIIEIIKEPSIKGVYRVILDKPTKISGDNIFEVYREYDVIHGRFTAYDLMDFDFDFYSTQNSELGELEYEEIDSNEIESHRQFFTALSPILPQQDVDDLITPETIFSEYDRLKENVLKETALKSRVVPTINKFKLASSTNARMLEYTLNANEAFGTDNLSPNNQIFSDRNPEYLNMEHFHFNKIPSDYYINQKLTGLKSFLDFNGDGGVSIDELKSTSFNYFESYFNWNGCYNASEDLWVNDEFRKLYTNFSSESIEDETSTVFRGLRYSFRKRKEFKQDVPTEFINSSEIDNYKFGVVLSYVSNENVEINSTNIQVIKNDVFKFICVHIEISAVENKVTELNRISSYTLTDLIDINDKVLNVDIPFQIDFGSSEYSNTDPDAEWVLEASQFATDGGSAAFNKYITPDADGIYSYIYFEYGGSNYVCKVINVIDDSRVLIKGWPYEVLPDGSIDQGSRLPSSTFSLISIIPSISNFKYFRGGANEFYNLLESINSYKLTERFNQFDNIEYLTIKEDSILENEFMLTISDGTQFTKPSLIENASDPAKPRAYQLSSGEIGKVVVDRKDGGYITLLRRMNGGYNPITKNVISFTDIYTENKIIKDSYNEREFLIYNKFNNLGVAFSSYKNVEENYGFINNYFYHKVNDENSKNILKLSQTSDKLPVYPKIGEIAIAKKNINLFKSKYASDYYSKALPGGKNDEVYGTLSPVEKKNFMVSTIMKVKNNYDLTTFTSNYETSVEDLDNIRLNSKDTNSIHWFENEQEVVMDFYLPTAIAEELKEDGILDKFKIYVDPKNSFGNKETIGDDLDLYIRSNIINRFIIDAVELYGIESKAIKTGFTSVNNESDLISDGYKKLTNYTIMAYQNDALSFRLIYNKRNGYSNDFKVLIKIQA